MKVRKVLLGKGKVATRMTFDDIVEMQAFVLERAETAGIDLQEIKRLLQRWESDVKENFQKSDRMNQRSTSSNETNAHAELTKKQMMRSRGLNLSMRKRRTNPKSLHQEEE